LPPLRLRASAMGASNANIVKLSTKVAAIVLRELNIRVFSLNE
jgi:hypothetical protein